MTYEEYNEKMDWYSENITPDNEELLEEMCNFQMKYMTEVLTELRSTADTKAKEVVCDILEYAINCSESGNTIESVETEELANEVDEIIDEMIGDYMLDAPEIYKDEYSGEWAIDCMFGGYYVPYWDGWVEDDCDW